MNEVLTTLANKGGAPMGAAATLGAVALCLTLLWKSGGAGAQQKLTLILATIVFGVVGLVMGATTIELFVTQTLHADYWERGLRGIEPIAPSTTVLYMQAGVMTVLLATTIVMVYKRQAVGAATVGLLFTMSIAAFANMAYFQSFQTVWYHGVEISWCFVAGMLVTFGAICVTEPIRNRRKQKLVNNGMAVLDANGQPSACQRFIDRTSSEYRGLLDDELDGARLRQ